MDLCLTVTVHVTVHVLLFPCSGRISPRPAQQPVSTCDSLMECHCHSRLIFTQRSRAWPSCQGCLLRELSVFTESYRGVSDKGAVSVYGELPRAV